MNSKASNSRIPQAAGTRSQRPLCEKHGERKHLKRSWRWRRTTVGLGDDGFAHPKWEIWWETHGDFSRNGDLSRNMFDLAQIGISFIWGCGYCTQNGLCLQFMALFMGKNGVNNCCDTSFVENTADRHNLSGKEWSSQSCSHDSRGFVHRSNSEDKLFPHNTYIYIYVYTYIHDTAYNYFDIGVLFYLFGNSAWGLGRPQSFHIGLVEGLVDVRWLWWFSDLTFELGTGCTTFPATIWIQRDGKRSHPFRRTWMSLWDMGFCGTLCTVDVRLVSKCILTPE